MTLRALLVTPTLAILLACPGGDPCSAALNFANACGSSMAGDGGTEAFRAQCDKQLARCTASERAELAAMYDCAASKKECNPTSLSSSTCVSEMKVSTVMCLTRGCQGSPRPCSSLFDQASCTAATGCSWTACSGTPSSCNLRSSQSTCTSLQGCSWSSTSNTCSGTAAACATFTTSSACAAQSGCNSFGQCSGTSAGGTCDGTSSASCEAVPGCRWGG